MDRAELRRRLLGDGSAPLREAYPELWRMVRRRPAGNVTWRRWWWTMLTAAAIAGPILIVLFVTVAPRPDSVAGVAIFVAVSFAASVAAGIVLRERDSPD